MKYFCLILVALPVSAGVRLKIDVTDLTTNKTTQEEILLDANRLRVNNDANSSTLFLTDGGSNRIVMLDKTKNEYREMDQQTINQMGQQMSQAQAKMADAMKKMTPEQRAMMEQAMKGKMPALPGSAPAAAPATIHAAKGAGTVNGFACTKYDGMRDGEKITEICAAQPAQLKISPNDLQVFDKLKDFVGSLTSGIANSPVGGSFAQMTDKGVSGLPVQTIRYTNGKASEKTELKSLDRAAFSDTDFSLGTAKKAQMPSPQGKR